MHPCLLLKRANVLPKRPTHSVYKGLAGFHLKLQKKISFTTALLGSHQFVL